MKFLFGALLLLMQLSAGAQTVYTDYGIFTQVIAGFRASEAIRFDDLSAGTAVSAYGPLSISASGLNSDGITSINIPLAVSNAYLTTSGANGFGPADGVQFLAGNSDKVTFTFSEPVNAFGVMIVGNPSPTGSPALPFWRLSANIGAGFAAYSTTEPISTFGDGNDVYFVGIVSLTEKFDRAELFSDNDPAAVFSFNCDDITYASIPAAMTIPEAKWVDGDDVSIIDAVVSRVHEGRFNIATASPLAGIAVLGNAAIAPNKKISLWGRMSETPDEERVIELGNVIICEEDVDAPGPYIMQSKNIGGASDIGYQKGAEESSGLNNIGLDVTLCGRVTATDSDWITVDDGCGMLSGMTDFLGLPATGIKVVGYLNFKSYNVGDFVIVRGSVSLHRANDKRMPLVRVADSIDVTKVISAK